MGNSRPQRSNARSFRAPNLPEVLKEELPDLEKWAIHYPAGRRRLNCEQH